MAYSDINELARRVNELRKQTLSAVGQMIIGLDSVTLQMLTAMLAGGHALLEGVPGTAKTTLCRTFAQVLGIDYQRVQFTPDLLPSDVTGTQIFDRESSQFELRKGPIFCQILLADELNRAPARTQSALLEAMQERQVTIEGHTLPLPAPFMVLATQNPIEQEGVYRLPEAQLDRFLFLMKTARAHALLRGSPYLTHEDIQAIALPVLGHRLIMQPEAEMEGDRVSEIVTQLIESVPVLKSRGS